LKIQENCFYRLWYQLRNNTRLEENEKKAYNFITTEVIQKILLKPGFSAIKTRINKLTATILIDVRTKFQE
jgi:hypothetical protein